MVLENDQSRKLKILAVSDQVDPRIHSTSLRQRMPDIDIVVGCGDVPARYLEFLADALDKPVYFVLGNHHEELTRKGMSGKRYEPMGCVDLGGKLITDQSTGLIIAGFPGSPKYSRETDQQYSNREIAWMMIKMAPRLFFNKWTKGRALDVVISHSPPRHINDREDVPHQGFPVMRRFLSIFKPAVHLHGHVHIYDRNEVVEHTFGDSFVINVYPFRQVELMTEPHSRAAWVQSERNQRG
jgi:Icc-related predicted phosphoesterase